MKQIKQYLAAALAVALIFAMIPPTAIARAAESAYEVLAEYTWDQKVYFSNYSNDSIIVSLSDPQYMGAVYNYDNGKCINSEFYPNIYHVTGNLYCVYDMNNEPGTILIDKTGNIIKRVPDSGVFEYMGSDTEYLFTKFTNNYSQYYIVNIFTDEYIQIPENVFFELQESGRNPTGLYPIETGYIEDVVNDVPVCYFVYSYADETGNVVLPGPYYNATEFVDGYAAYTDSGKVKFIDSKGTVVKETSGILNDYSGWQYYNQCKMVPVYDNDVGLYGLEGINVHIPAQYQIVYNIGGEAFYVEDTQGNSSVIGAGGKIIIPSDRYNYVECVITPYIKIDDVPDESIFYTATAEDETEKFFDTDGNELQPNSEGYHVFETGAILNGKPVYYRSKQTESYYCTSDGEQLFSDKNLVAEYGHKNENANYSYSLKYRSNKFGYWIATIVESLYSSWSYDVAYGIINDSGDIIVPFEKYDSYYPRSDGLVWAYKYDEQADKTTLALLKIPGSAASEPSPIPEDNIYDTYDPGAEVEDLLDDPLDKVIDTATAFEAVTSLTDRMTEDQKLSPTGVSLAVLLAEASAAKLSGITVTGNVIVVDPASAGEKANVSKEIIKALTEALTASGITVPRELSNTVTYTTAQTQNVTVVMSPGVADAGIDNIRIETPAFALTLDTAELERENSGTMTFVCSSVPETKSVKIELPGGSMTSPVTLSFPVTGSAENLAVKDTNNAVSTSKYNPVTSMVDSKLLSSGTYSVQESSKDFTDISSKSQEMQTAIKYLASMGIINGTGDGTTFSPDGTISRAETAALIVRALGKEDKNATANFIDVTAKDWYYSAAASSQKWEIIKGDDKGAFRGTDPITKNEAVIVAARVLEKEMGYTYPADPSVTTRRYLDGVVSWAQKEVALATNQNLIVYRMDGNFAGTKNMTRGDVAILIYRLFQKLW